MVYELIDTISTSTTMGIAVMSKSTCKVRSGLERNMVKVDEDVVKGGKLNLT